MNLRNLFVKTVQFSVIGFAILTFAEVFYPMFLTPQTRAVRKNLSVADSNSEFGIYHRLSSLKDFFAKGRENAKGFAAETVAWKGKVATVKGFVLDDSHKDFLAQVFARHIFSPDQLRAVIEGICRAYEDDLIVVENEMLPKLRFDLTFVEYPSGQIPSYLRSNEAFSKEYRKVADRLTEQMQWNMEVIYGREVMVLTGTGVSYRVTLLAAKGVASEMGVEGGLLLVNSSSAAERLGVGIIVAVIVDYVLDVLFKMDSHDPEAKIATALVKSLDMMEAALIRDPDLRWYVNLDKKGSLREEMEKLHKARSRLRREAVASLLKEGGEK